jgi:glycosyltransferase involved in cell wall biosynthesis/tetratricopeptide (TPR) repeat protein
MAVSRQVDDTPWVAVWKNRLDAEQSQVLRLSDDPFTIRADFSTCEFVSRLLWPVPVLDIQAQNDVLHMELEVLATKLAPSEPIEWVALVQGTSAENVAFFKKLEQRVDVGKRPQKFEWSLSAGEAARLKGSLFLCLHFHPQAKPIEFTFRSSGLEAPRPARPRPVSVQARSAPPPEPPAPAAQKPASEKPPAPSFATVLSSDGSVPAATLRSMSEVFTQLAPEHLIAAWNKLEEQVLLKRIKTWHKERSWPELVQLGAGLDAAQPHRREALTLLGRAQIYAQNTPGATKLLGRLSEDCPEDADANFYAAVAFGRDNKSQQALDLVRRAIAIKPKSGQYWAEQAAIQRRLAGEMEDPAARDAMMLESAQSWLGAMELDPKLKARGHARLAQVYLDLSRFDQALVHADAALAEAPRTVDILMMRGKVLLALNRVKEALAVAEEVCAIDPAHQGARFQLRALRNLAEDDGDDLDASICLFSVDDDGATIQGKTYTLEGEELRAANAVTESAADAELSRILGELSAEWLVFEGWSSDAGIAAWLMQCRNQVPRWCGRVLGRTASGEPIEMWRRDLVQGLVDSGLIESAGSLASRLGELASVVATVDLSAPRTWSAEGAVLPAGQRQEGLVVAMSKHGIVKFGGGEQFLDSMAEHYQDMGYRVVIGGTRPEMVGQSGFEGDREFVFVDESPAALRRFFIEQRPALVHVLSGLGFQVAAALDYLNIPFVYGVHFWRDCLGLTDEHTKFFENFDRDPIPKPAFRYVLQRAATVYSNSEYTLEVLEQAFQCRTPILYSLPREIDPELHDAREAEAEELIGDLSDFVLLVNAKSDKGFDLLLQTAKLAPEITFVAIASQSDWTEAQAAVKAAGLDNFRILPRTNRIELLYQRSRVVAVPSYRFVETFSRVCIEAQRFSKPVLGSDRGNVPYLLSRSGVVLPEDAAAWAAELLRIYGDAEYHASLVAKAEANASHYDYESQRRAVHGVVSTLGSQVLIGIGSGIGNMLHAGPMVRNIARRLGRKVDIVVAEDHRNSLFLLHHRDYVNASFSLRQNLLRKRYDTVFLTHCFGGAPVQFHARQVISSRSWINFEPGGPYHETVFNLEAAKRLLGIDYDEQDVTQYYVGDYAYTPPVRGRRIGLHGGSKEGFWTSKRWPEYKELAEALTERGYEVASFGIEPEYVEGTVNLTGGTISEMIDQMLTCSYFVSNDSGLMNIANALGIPMTSLFGPTNPATRGPLRPSSSYLAINKDCSPCEITKTGKATFLAGECRCIAELPFDRVLNHVLSEMTRAGLPIDLREGAEPSMAVREDQIEARGFLPGGLIDRLPAASPFRR